MVWYGIVWYGMVWYMVWYKTSSVDMRSILHFFARGYQACQARPATSAKIFSAASAKKYQENFANIFQKISQTSFEKFQKHLSKNSRPTARFREIEFLERQRSQMNKREMTTTPDIENIVFSEPKTSGNFKKIGISNPNGKKIMIETEGCFSRGIQKSDRYDSYSMPLVLKNIDQTVKILREILQKYNEHLPEMNFDKCLYEKLERATTTIYPKLRYYGGKFNTSIYEGDKEVSPLQYLNVRCSARALICVESILLGDTTTLQIKVYEEEVTEKKEPERSPERRLLSKQC